MKKVAAKEVGVFIASSIHQFHAERVELSNFIRYLDSQTPNLILKPVRCEEALKGDLHIGGSQAVLNQEIPKCEYFVLLVGNDIGPYTEEEFNIALNSFASHGKPKIYIFLYRPKHRGVTQVISKAFGISGFTERMSAFLQKIRSQFQHYVDEYPTLADIKLCLLQNFIDDGIFSRHDVEMDNGVIKLNGMKVLSTEDIPVYSDNKQLQSLKQEKKRLDAQYAEKRLEKHAHPDCKDIEIAFWDIAKKRESVEMRIQQLEQGLWDATHTMRDVLRPGDMVEECTFRAIQAYHAGDLERTMSELDDTTWSREAYAISQEVSQNSAKIQAHIDQKRVKIAALKSCGITRETRPQILTAYQEATKLAYEQTVGMSIWYEYAEFLCDQREYSDAIYAGETLRDYYQYKKTGTALERACLNDLLGICHSRNQEFPAAISCYKVALSDLKKCDRYEKSNPILSMICRHLCNVLYSRNHFEEAEGYLHMAFPHLEQLVKENPYVYRPRIIEAYDSMSVMLEKNRYFNSAEVYREKTLAYCKQYSAFLEQAERGCIDQARQGKDFPDQKTRALISKIYNNWGVALRDDSRWQEEERLTRAENVLRMALVIREDLAEENPEAYERRVAQSNNNLGAVLKNRGDFSKKNGCPEKAELFYQEAEALIRKSIEIRERDSQKKKRVYLSRSYVNLANLLVETGHGNEAGELYRKALQYREELNMEDREAYEQYLASICFAYGIFQYNVWLALPESQRSADNELFQESRRLLKRAASILEQEKYSHSRNGELEEIRKILRERF